MQSIWKTCIHLESWLTASSSSISTRQMEQKSSFFCTFSKPAGHRKRLLPGPPPAAAVPSFYRLKPATSTTTDEQYYDTKKSLFDLTEWDKNAGSLYISLMEDRDPFSIYRENNRLHSFIELARERESAATYVLKTAELKGRRRPQILA
ncbi:hypothetical protein OIU85_028567 [Salix viminalis]|uniref:Uncharacterized protein n=1 Tax=Salix viminalis TaxID=40686 RepID=A0A9Q0QKD2_SALVM|nr:hypothetical protein OIU85_028567 [Salix viminalis]